LIACILVLYVRVIGGQVDKKTTFLMRQLTIYFMMAKVTYLTTLIFGVYFGAC